MRLSDMALSIRPDSFEALFAKSRALLALGDLRGALDDVNQAIALVPQHNRTARKVLLKLREEIEIQFQNALD